MVSRKWHVVDTYCYEGLVAHPHYEEGEGEDHHLVLLLTNTAYCCFYPHYEEGEGEDYVVAVHQLRGTAPGADQVPGLALGARARVRVRVRARVRARVKARVIG